MRKSVPVWIFTVVLIASILVPVYFVPDVGGFSQQQ